MDLEILRILIAVVLGFLCFNFPGCPLPRYRVFMGDAGSMLLGLIMGYYAVRFSQFPIAVVRPINMLWIMAMPLLDTVAAILRRIRKGLSPFHPDKVHVHHILLQAGYSPLQTVVTIGAGSLILGLIGYFSNTLDINQGLMFFVFLLAAIIYLLIIRYAWRFMRLIKRDQT
jgi:UDP-GlcNAc:undecaprenyl-phosphate GlcNAc-1-phosphate transferase